MCENPGEPWPPVADAHGHSRLDDEETEQGSSQVNSLMFLFNL